jgi:hypothetical protein
MPTQKVEIGFDLAGNNGPFFVLDDTERGVLDNTAWTLAGTFFYDVTQYVKDIQISRGKNRDIDSYSAGESVVTMNNYNRYFDPTFQASPFYGNIIPRREVRISSNGIQQYFGTIDDWNLAYSINGESVVTFVTSDGFYRFNNQTLTPGTATVQTTGNRINAVLDDPNVAWPSAFRAIDTGVVTAGADVIADNTNALAYLKLVEKTEFGAFFIAKNGKATFKDRTVVQPISPPVTLSDTDESGIGYSDIRITYGSEQLANEIVVSSVVTESTVTAVDLASQGVYGVLNLTLSDLLMNTDEQVEDLAVYLANKYSQPEYRFEAVEIILDDLSPEDQNKILNLELNDVVKIQFTPNGIGPAIQQYVEIININHRADLQIHRVTLGLARLDFLYFILDDPTFGTLNTDNALGY